MEIDGSRTCCFLWIEIRHPCLQTSRGTGACLTLAQALSTGVRTGHAMRVAHARLDARLYWIKSNNDVLISLPATERDIW